MYENNAPLLYSVNIGGTGQTSPLDVTNFYCNQREEHDLFCFPNRVEITNDGSKLRHTVYADNVKAIYLEDSGLSKKDYYEKPNNIFLFYAGCLNENFGGQGEDKKAKEIAYMISLATMKKRPSKTTIILKGYSRGAVTCLKVVYWLNFYFRKIKRTNYEIHLWLVDPLQGRGDDILNKGIYSYNKVESLTIAYAGKRTFIDRLYCCEFNPNTEKIDTSKTILTTFRVPGYDHLSLGHRHEALCHLSYLFTKSFSRGDERSEYKIARRGYNIWFTASKNEFFPFHCEQAKSVEVSPLFEFKPDEEKYITIIRLLRGIFTLKPKLIQRRKKPQKRRRVYGCGCDCDNEYDNSE